MSFAGTISYWLCPSYKRVCGSVGCLAPFCDVTDLPASSIAVFEACELNGAGSSTGASVVTERLGVRSFREDSRYRQGQH